MQSSRETSFIPLVIVMLALLLWVANRETDKLVEETLTPDFSAIHDVKTKKQPFFAYLLPLMQQSNKDISQERAVLLKISKRFKRQRALTEKQTTTIRLLAKKYRVTMDEPLYASAITQLDRRIDTIPAALALAQTTNESAWGTSQFAVKGNNYFGLLCWSNNCGLAPNDRAEGRSHEVSRFNAPIDSVKYYMQTLNSHPAYKKLRDLRFSARANNDPTTGTLLAGGLLAYSERGAAYIEEIRTMIRINNLDQFDRAELILAP